MFNRFRALIWVAVAAVIAPVLLAVSSPDLSARAYLLSTQKLSTRNVYSCPLVVPGPVYLPAGTTSWTVPLCWNTVKVEVVAAGGSAAAASASVYGGPGAGAAYSSGQLNVTPGASITVGVPVGPTGPTTTSNSAGTVGGDAWFNAASFAACTNPALCVSAKGGGAGNTGVPPAAATGGQASASIGNLVKNNGGNGPSADGAAGGGAAGGPNGAGQAGATAGGLSTGSNGGAADNGLQGAGGLGVTANPPNNGLTGTLFGVRGPGGGGGGNTGSGTAARTGGDGGLCGGGGAPGSTNGAASSTGGKGGDACIYITRINWLLKRDLGHANDNTPMFLNRAA